MSTSGIPIDDSTILEKSIACLTGFGFACVAFCASATILLPVVGHLASEFDLPGLIAGPLIIASLFGTTIFAGIAGVAIQAKHFARRHQVERQS